MVTILTTAKKQGLNRFEQLCRLAGPSPLQAASATTCVITDMGSSFKTPDRGPIHI